MAPSATISKESLAQLQAVTHDGCRRLRQAVNVDPQRPLVNIPFDVNDPETWRPKCQIQALQTGLNMIKRRLAEWERTGVNPQELNEHLREDLLRLGNIADWIGRIVHDAASELRDETNRDNARQKNRRLTAAVTDRAWFPGDIRRGRAATRAGLERGIEHASAAKAKLAMAALSPPWERYAMAMWAGRGAIAIAPAAREAAIGWTRLQMLEEHEGTRWATWEPRSMPTGLTKAVSDMVHHSMDTVERVEQQRWREYQNETAAPSHSGPE